MIFGQSINIVESPRLRSIFLMLRPELKERDIPHRTKIRKRIMELWNEYLEKLKNELKVRSYKLLCMVLIMDEVSSYRMLLDSYSSHRTFGLTQT